jgi:serine acetyltransferase
MNLFSYLFQDWAANAGNIKGRFVLFLFRLAQVISRHILLKIIFILYLAFYHYYVEWVLGIELPRKLRVGKGLMLYHGQALVVNQGVVIGEGCTLRNSVTIGHKKLADGRFSKCPRIGNHVDIGANVCIIGDLDIGDHVVIGAGAVVVKSIPANSIVVGNPARILEKKNEVTGI